MIKKLIESKSWVENIFNCIEEFSEVIKTLTKIERCRMSGTITNLPRLRRELLEERVDAELSIQAIDEMFEFTEHEIQEEREKKMKRNLARLGE